MDKKYSYRDIRKDLLKLNQHEMAVVMEIGFTAWRSIENGTSDCPTKVMARIIQKTGLKYEQILSN